MAFDAVLREPAVKESNRTPTGPIAGSLIEERGMRLLERLVPTRHEPGHPITVQAVWKATVLAESSRTVLIDGKRYFPPDDVRWELLRRNDKETVCAWKGYAGYYDVDVAGQVKRSVAWVYADPQPAASELKGRVAFSRAVKVRPAPDD